MSKIFERSVKTEKLQRNMYETFDPIKTFEFIPSKSDRFMFIFWIQVWF